MISANFIVAIDKLLDECSDFEGIYSKAKKAGTTTNYAETTLHDAGPNLQRGKHQKQVIVNIHLAVFSEAWCFNSLDFYSY